MACDHSFVIINESSVDLFDIVPAASPAAYHLSGVSGDHAESDWQLEGSCHGSLAGPEKRRVKLQALLPSRKGLQAAIVPCNFTHLCLEPGQKEVACMYGTHTRRIFFFKGLIFKQQKTFVLFTES